MLNISKTTILIGILLLGFSLINGFTTDVSLDNSNFRSEVLSSISSIIIIGLGFILKQIEPHKSLKVDLIGYNGFNVNEDLNQLIKEELAWRSQQILTATAAATILIYFDEITMLKRGIISDKTFVPGDICNSAIERSKMVNLVNTKNYPGSYEFDSVIKDLPSIIVFPLAKKGCLIVGGWSPRCFTKSDEIWIKGWSEKLLTVIDRCSVID